MLDEVNRHGAVAIKSSQPLANAPGILDSLMDNAALDEAEVKIFQGVGDLINSISSEHVILKKTVKEMIKKFEALEVPTADDSSFLP